MAHIWHNTTWVDGPDGSPVGGVALTYVCVEGHWFVEVPSKRDRHPAGWWHLAAITGIGAGRFQGLDGEERGRVLDDVVDRLEHARAEAARLGGPVLGAGLEGWRRWVVSTRYAASGGQWKPYCFTGRASDLADRAMHLMADVLGPGRALFRVAQPDGWRIAVATTDPGQNPDATSRRAARPAARHAFGGGGGRVRLTVARDKDVMSALLRRTVNFCRTGYPPKQVAVPQAVAGELKSMAPMWLPELVGVARLPMLDASTADYRPSGYDAGSKRYVDPDFDPWVALGGPTTVARSLNEALWAFSDFPLVDGWGPLLALLLEPIVRPLSSGVRPLWVIDAPAAGQGTGKTLLARSVAALAEGRDPGVMVLPTSDSELEKRITAVVRSGKEVHIFDNVTGTVRSPALAALSTSTTWEGRTLGVSEAPPLPLVTTWIFTSNQARLNRDLARRCAFVRLNAGAGARDRTGFKVRDLVSYLLERRPVVMSHLSELVRAWLVAGAPGPAGVVRLASYESWLQVTGGVLSWLDGLGLGPGGAGLGLVAGLSAALREGAGRDVDTADEAAFVAAWREAFGEAPVTLTPLLALAEAGGLFADFFAGAGGGTWRVRKFGQEVLPRLLGVSFDGWSVVGPVADDKGRLRAYALRRNNSEQPTNETETG